AVGEARLAERGAGPAGVPLRAASEALRNRARAGVAAEGAVLLRAELLHLVRDPVAVEVEFAAEAGEGVSGARRIEVGVGVGVVELHLGEGRVEGAAGADAALVAVAVEAAAAGPGERKAVAPRLAHQERIVPVHVRAAEAEGAVAVQLAGLHAG